jgi:transcriptional regulator with XRE-family HTH domain
MEYDIENITIAQNIRKIRDIRGFSQEFVAEKLDLSQSAYSKIEQGKTLLTEELKEKIAATLEVSKKLLESYNDNMIFNYCNQSGNVGDNNTYNYNPLEKLETVYSQLIAEKDARIKLLEAMIKKH